MAEQRGTGYSAAFGQMKNNDFHQSRIERKKTQPMFGMRDLAVEWKTCQAPC
jgi:hypothetical protein